MRMERSYTRSGRLNSVLEIQDLRGSVGLLGSRAGLYAEADMDQMVTLLDICYDSKTATEKLRLFSGSYAFMPPVSVPAALLLSAVLRNLR